MPDGFIELQLNLFQTEQLRPLIDGARAKRNGILLLAAIPDVPNPLWRLQVCALSQRGCERIRKIVREELASQK
jgi:hypothetical protein